MHPFDIGPPAANGPDYASGMVYFMNKKMLEFVINPIELTRAFEDDDSPTLREVKILDAAWRRDMGLPSAEFP